MDTKRGLELLYEGICPICKRRMRDYDELYHHLLDHCDGGQLSAEKYLMEAYRLAVVECGHELYPHNTPF